MTDRFTCEKGPCLSYHLPTGYGGRTATFGAPFGSIERPRLPVKVHLARPAGVATLVDFREEELGAPRQVVSVLVRSP